MLNIDKEYDTWYWYFDGTRYYIPTETNLFKEDVEILNKDWNLLDTLFVVNKNMTLTAVEYAEIFMTLIDINEDLGIKIEFLDSELSAIVGAASIHDS